MKTRQPQDRQKLVCTTCNRQMSLGECRYLTLPNVLLVKVNRNQKDTELWSKEYVDFPDSLDLAGFTTAGFKGATSYELNSTVCLADNNL